VSTEPIVMANAAHEYTEFSVRWTMELGQSMFTPWGSRAAAAERLGEPLAGALSGELVRRTVTISPWTVVPGVATVQGLFAQPKHDHNLPGFPSDVVRDSANHEGLRYLILGDDGETVVVLGHPHRDELTTFQQWYAKEHDFELDDGFVSEPFETYSRQLHRCPTHEQKNADCTWCMFISEDEPWLDWSAQKDDGRLVNAGKPGYFPVVVWEVGS
jgi:hypothetical protein